MKTRTLSLCATILLGLVFGAGLTFACQEPTEYRGMQPVSIQEAEPDNGDFSHRGCLGDAGPSQPRQSPERSPPAYR